MSAFEGLVGELEYPMFIVTTKVDGEPLGCLVGFTTQAGIDPPGSCSAVRQRMRRTSSRTRRDRPRPALLEPIAGASTPEDEFTFHRAKRIDPGHEA